MSIVLSTESVNRYGYRVLTSGIDLKAFKKNPIMLFDHRSYSMFPIGKWENIRVEDGKLIADPVFDEDDETALMLKKKYDKGMLNAASISISTKTVSDDPKYLLKGQTRSTVIKCELREVSIVTIPGNAEAVKLSAEQSTGIDEIIPKLNLNSNMEKVLLQLGLAPGASEDQVVEAIKRLQTQKKELSASRIAEKLAEGRKAGVITEDNEAAYKSALSADYDSAVVLLNDAIGHVEKKDEGGEQTLSDAIKDAKKDDQKPKGREDWTFDDYQKKDPKALLNMKESKPEEYKALFLASQNRK